MVRARLIVSSHTRLRGAFVGLGMLLSASGCGAAAYSYHSVQAARSVEQARAVDAENLAPFEHTMAETYLDKAREASSEAQYQDAIHFARWSKRMADKAVEVARQRAEESAP